MTMPNTHPPLYATVADMLAAQTPPGSVLSRREAMPGSFSGARLERLTFSRPAGEQQLILKQLDLATGWQQRTTSDLHCREIQITQSSFWERMPPMLWSPVIGCVAEGPRGALLLEDLGRAVLAATRCYEPVDNDIFLWIIDRLADLHAAFWDDDELAAADWLASSADALLFMTPERLARVNDVDDTYGMQARRMWPYLWRFLEDETGTTLWRLLANPDRLLEAVRLAPHTLVHGDAWLANIGIRDGRMALLDWALATAGPAPYDSLWMAFTWQAAEPDAALIEHRSALLKRGVTAVRDSDTWELLCDLAWLRTFYTGAEWLVRDVRGAPDDAADRAARQRMHFWADRAARIIRARGWT